VPGHWIKVKNRTHHAFDRVRDAKGRFSKALRD
jgi:hypothetical protein